MLRYFPVHFYFFLPSQNFILFFAALCLATFYKQVLIHCPLLCLPSYQGLTQESVFCIKVHPFYLYWTSLVCDYRWGNVQNATGLEWANLHFFTFNQMMQMVMWYSPESLLPKLVVSPSGIRTYTLKTNSHWFRCVISGIHHTVRSAPPPNGLRDSEPAPSIKSLGTPELRACLGFPFSFTNGANGEPKTLLLCKAVKRFFLTHLGTSTLVPPQHHKGKKP